MNAVKVLVIGYILAALTACQSPAQSDIAENNFTADMANSPKALRAVPNITPNKIIPIYKPQPSFPDKATQQKQSGWVLVQFDISELGETQNIKVMDVSHARYGFEQAATIALSQWLFTPKIIGDKALTQQELKYIFEFNYEGEFKFY